VSETAVQQMVEASQMSVLERGNSLEMREFEMEQESDMTIGLGMALLKQIVKGLGIKSFVI
jgi:hypothetical protein